MKRLLIFLVFVVIASLGTVMADDPQGENTIELNPKFDNPIGGHGNLPKGEIPIVYAEQNGHDLYFDLEYAGCLLTLSDGEDIVYSTYIPVTGIVYLPSTLYGMFDITMYTGIYCFVGEITL